MSLESLAMRRAAPQVDAETLSRSLARAGLRHGSSPPLEIERGWPLAKIPLLLRCSDPESPGKDPAWWSFYFLDSEELPFLCRSALKNGTAFYLDEIRAVVQSFPSDLQLMGVEQASHKKTALPVVKSVLAEGAAWSSLTARILGYKSSRRLTVRYRLHRESGRGRTLFGKLYPPGWAQAAYEIQRDIEEVASHPGEDRFSWPVIEGIVESWNALLWRRARGRTLYDRLSEPDPSEWFDRIGRCLGNLHSGDIALRRTHDRAKEQDTVQSWIRAAGVVEGSTYPELRETYLRLRSSALEAEHASLVPSHRDFFDKQILVTDDRFTLLDLELVSCAEPELDVTNFLVHLVLRSLQGRLDVPAAASCFLQGYRRTGPLLDNGRFRWYSASSLLRLACVYSLRPEWKGIVSRLGQAANRALEGEPVLMGETLWSR